MKVKNPETGEWEEKPWVDFVNPDGSEHVNYAWFDQNPNQANMEFDPTSGQSVEAPGYVDYINPDGSPHYNYAYFDAPPAPEVKPIDYDRQLNIQPAYGRFRPEMPTIEQLRAWRPEWLPPLKL